MGIFKKYWLISYSCDLQSNIRFGCDIIDYHPSQWIAEVQDLSETYILINAIRVSRKYAKRYDGELKGM